MKDLESKRGYIYLYTGEGAGKTTNALGLVVRMLGHNKHVLMVQFLKWNNNTGEYLFQNKVSNFTLKQFGRNGWHGYSNLNGVDRCNCISALNYIKYYLELYTPNLLILDEINLVVHLKLLSNEEVIEFLNSLPEHLDVIMTGRYATEELKDRADFVNEIKEIKVPKDIPCNEGIQF